MSLHNLDQHLLGLYKTSLGNCDAYEPSVVSSAASSQASVFSETASEQSSIASSICDDFRIPRDEVRDRACAQAQLRCIASQASCHAVPDFVKADCAPAGVCSSLSCVDATSAPARQHPRRSSLARHQKPPTLQRQQDRKTHFVDSLVDSASQMVEVIWPLSVVPCGAEASGGRGVLPLRTYIEETLRRSRTSYSTLQVALYYLVLIKAHVPKNDFTKEQHMDCLANRALMCGRRMFLAALILASKYLQDRNYSAKAWSKMSGLSVLEINTNERTFLAKVDFKLHIPDPLFTRWTEIVLKYTPNTQPPPPGQSFSKPSCWRSIIPLLTPELDTVSLPWSRPKPGETDRARLSLATPTPTATPSSFVSAQSSSHESTPTPKTAPSLPLPRFLEPRPTLNPPTPALVRMGPLPTPQLTPSSVAASTPAVSACGSRRPSMCAAMALMQAANFNRCTLDTYPSKESCSVSRRPSLISAASSRSSPESMMSDLSRTSRASSISSVSTMSSHASLAHGRADLARRATCRNVRPPLPTAPVMEEREAAAALPIRVVTDGEMTSSPEMTDFSISEKKFSMPHKHTKYAPQPIAAPSADRGRKRCRPRGHGARRSDLHEEVRIMLEDQLELDGKIGLETEVDDDDDDDNDDSEYHFAGINTPSRAVDYATRMLYAESKLQPKCIQPPATLSRRGSYRKPVQRTDGSNKRSCCSTSMTLSPATLPYEEVM